VVVEGDTPPGGVVGGYTPPLGVGGEKRMLVGGVDKKKMGCRTNDV